MCNAHIFKPISVRFLWIVYHIMELQTKLPLNLIVYHIMVVDNCTANDAMIVMLLDEFESKSLILFDAFLHMRCVAHILKLIVKDGLDVIDCAVQRIQKCVAFWTLSPERIEKFMHTCRSFGLNSFKMFLLDYKTI